MQTALYGKDLEHNKNRLIIVSYVNTGDEVTVRFVLHDPVEGLVYGMRTFRQTTAFRDHEDLIDELWAGNLAVIPLPVSDCFCCVKNNPPD